MTLSIIKIVLTRSENISGGLDRNGVIVLSHVIHVHREPTGNQPALLLGISAADVPNVSRWQGHNAVLSRDLLPKHDDLK